MLKATRIKRDGFTRTGYTVGVAILLLMAQGCSTTSTATGSPSPATGSTSPATASCTMPLTVDPYQGFHIGVPDGWALIRLNGTIFVTKDPTSTEGAAVRPALMTAGLTAATYFQAALATLQQQLASVSLTMTSTMTSSGAQLPAASLSIQSGGASLAGKAHVEIRPFPTAYGASMVALIASWAPQGQFATDTSLLAGIGACYGPQQGTLYRVVKDQVFTYAIPLGWQTTSETQDSIEIDKGTDAGASFNLLPALPLDSGVNSPQTLFTWATNKLGIQVGQIIGSTSSPNQTTSTGAVAGQGIVEFTGTFKGQQIHGFAFLFTTSSPGFNTSGLLRLAFATTAMWNSLNGALIHIVGSIQHDFTQDLKEWERLSQQWQAFGQQVQGFDYALTGVDLVNDPTTGATFEAPYATYTRSGPDGPGYYSPAGTKLQVQTP